MSRPTTEEPRWLTPDDLSNLLQVSPGTVANWRSQGKGPAFKRIGGVVRYNPQVVDAWIEAQPSK